MEACTSSAEFTINADVTIDLSNLEYRLHNLLNLN